jgi:hypothetical protein
MDDSLLLYSLKEFDELIVRCLAVVGPGTIVEVGAEVGGSTTMLAEWAAEHEARLVCIEPHPSPELRELAAAAEHFQLVEGRSPQALEDLEPADVYLLDGDHNYYTASGELERIYGARPGGAIPPLTLMHDVGWPSGRRDQYSAPELLPREAVHEHTFELGVSPGEPGVAAGGFRGAGQFATATREGGPRNGVLTAVEDFLTRYEGYVYRQVPCIFGLGFIFSRTAAYASELESMLAPLDHSRLLERLERNRLLLYLKLIQANDAQAGVSTRQNRLLLHQGERLAELEADNATLRLELARLRAELEATNGRRAQL